MEYRQFGNTSLRVSEVGFGLARVGGVFQASRDSQLRLLRGALDAGINFYDTADMYAQGRSERLLGDAFRHDRDKVVIATKVGYVFPSDRSPLSRIKPLIKPLAARLNLKRAQLPRRMLTTVSSQDFSPAYIMCSVEASLRRLRSDYIDIYQLHSPPLAVIEQGEFVATLASLQGAGKIRHWGIACEDAEAALVCAGLPGIGSIQISVSLLHQDALDAAIPRATDQGIGVIARQVFASGLLTRRPDEHHAGDRGDEVEDGARQHTSLLELQRVADERGRALSDIALGFVLAQPGVSVALLGMHAHRHLAQVCQYLATPLRASDYAGFRAR